jgi:uncharacterized membrane protein YadS
MKFAVDRPYSDPEKAARKLVEIANAVEAVQDGRIHIELIILTTVSMAALGLGVDVKVVAEAGLRVVAAVRASLTVLALMSLALIYAIGTCVYRKP